MSFFCASGDFARGVLACGNDALHDSRTMGQRAIHRLTTNSPQIALKVYRTIHQLNQTELAEQLACSVSMVTHVELGTRIPGLSLAVRIQELTGIDPARWVRS